MLPANGIRGAESSASILRPIHAFGEQALKLQNPIMVSLARAGWRERFAVGGLILLSGSAFLSTAGASIGLALISMAFVADFDRWRLLLSSSVTLATVAAAIFVMAHTLVFALQNPELSADLGEGMADWLKLLWFIPFGFCLGGNLRLFVAMLGLALAGLIIGMFRKLDWALLLSDPSAYLAVSDGFGFTDTAFALYSGTALIGLVTLGGRVLGATGSGRPWRTAALALAWLAALAVLAQGFIQSQSRGAWLAIGLTLAVILLERHRQSRAQGRGWSLRSKVGAGMAVLVIAGLVAVNSGQLSRGGSTAEGDPSAGIPDGAEAGVPGSSEGLHSQVLMLGLEKWRERPWLGWGADISRELIEEGDAERLPLTPGRTLRHLQNSYLEVLVQFGIVGLVLIALPIVGLMAGLRRACNERRVPGDLCLFLGGALLFTLIWSLFDYRVVHHDWRVFWVLLAGSVYSFVLKWPLGTAGRPLEDRSSR